MMKKMICMVLAALLLASVFATTAFAAGRGQGHRQEQRATQKCAVNKVCQRQEVCPNNCVYADENGDSICDNCKNQCADCEMTVDENKDGICDQCGKCYHYRDTDSNGVCDHRSDCTNRKGNGTAKGHHGQKHKNHH